MTVFDDFLSAATTPIAWRRTRLFLARVRRHVDRMVAAAIARRERHATLAVLYCFSDRELRDMGIYRSQIDFGLKEAARERSAMQTGLGAAGRRTRTGVG